MNNIIENYSNLIYFIMIVVMFFLLVFPVDLLTKKASGVRTALSVTGLIIVFFVLAVINPRNFQNLLLLAIAFILQVFILFAKSTYFIYVCFIALIFCILFVLGGDEAVSQYLANIFIISLAIYSIKRLYEEK